MEWLQDSPWCQEPSGKICWAQTPPLGFAARLCAQRIGLWKGDPEAARPSSAAQHHLNPVHIQGNSREEVGVLAGGTFPDHERVHPLQDAVTHQGSPRVSLGWGREVCQCPRAQRREKGPGPRGGQWTTTAFIGLLLGTWTTGFWKGHPYPPMSQTDQEGGVPRPTNAPR
jgi:hypothetical protein